MTEGTALRLLYHLQAALSHSIRTPLSVIASDLHYLAASADCAEFGRTRTQCDKMSLILAEVSIPRARPLHLKEMNLCNLLSEAGMKSLDETEVEFLVSGDRELLSYACEHLSRAAEWNFRSFVGGIELSAQFAGETTGDFSLFSEAFNEIRAHDTLHAPIADAVFIAHGISVAGNVGRTGIRATITYRP